MISRALHMEIFITHLFKESTLIPNLSPVHFRKPVGQPIFTPHPADTASLKINEIVYDDTIDKFRVITMPTTQNDLLIIWCVSLNTCNGALMPTFSIIVEQEDGSLFGTFPSSGTRKQDTLFNSFLLHLPTPTIPNSRVDYYISLVNQSGADCFYSLKSYQVAGILITSIGA